MSYLPASASPAAQSLVLIAEDEAEIAEILAAYLQRHGLRTLHAADGRVALAMHQTCKPDLLLLDVQMPQLDGWQVLSEIRARGDTPVIMLTALDQDLDKLMGLRMGADDYVVKPSIRLKWWPGYRRCSDAARQQNRPRPGCCGSAPSRSIWRATRPAFAAMRGNWCWI